MPEPGPVVRTLSGDLAPGSLGPTLSHEHLILRAPPALAGDEGLSFGSAAGATGELGAFAEAEGGALAEMTTPEFGRDTEAMAAASRTSGIAVIASTGWQKGLTYPPWIETAQGDALAEVMVNEISDGIDRSERRAGVIKIGTSGTERLAAEEERVFAAAAAAHQATGVPLSTHLEAGTLGHAQLDALERAGVAPQRVLLGHLDRRLDWDYHRSLAERGAWLGFDQFTKSKYAPDEERVEMIGRLLEAGFSRILVSGDLGRSSYQPAYGGSPGFAGVLRRLRELLDPPTADLLVVDNPASFFAFDPR